MLRLIAFAASFALMSAGAYAQAPLNKDDLVQKLKPAPLTRSLTGDRAPTRQIVVEKGNEAAIIEGMRVLLSGWGAEVITSPTGDDVVAAVHAAGRAERDERLDAANEGRRLSSSPSRCHCCCSFSSGYSISA